MADNEVVPALPPSTATVPRNEPDRDAPSRGRMERTVSQDIREEREDLREAAEHSQNVILDLNLDGTVRLVSPSWQDVIGTPISEVQGKPIADLFTENKTVFADAIASIRKDDSRSQIIRFSMPIGPLAASRRRAERHKSPLTDDQDTTEQVVEERVYEAQGIMIYNRTSGGESHVCFSFPGALLEELTDLLIDHVDDPSLCRS